MSDPNDPRQIRVFVFPDRTDVILIYVPEGQELWLPRLSTPFRRYDVAKTLGDSDIPARVSESVPGRFTHTVQRALLDQKSERGQRAREAELVRHVTIRDDPNATTYQQKRASLVLAKQKVDDELRDLKLQLGRAKSKAFESGQYMAPIEYRNKERRIGDLQGMSLAMQRRLSELKQRQREEHDANEPEAIKIFLALAKEALGETRYLDLWRRARGDHGLEGNPYAATDPG